jgi:hypothetical protein
VPSFARQAARDASRSRSTASQSSTVRARTISTSCASSVSRVVTAPCPFLPENNAPRLPKIVHGKRRKIGDVRFFVSDPDNRVTSTGLRLSNAHRLSSRSDCLNRSVDNLHAYSLALPSFLAGEGRRDYAVGVGHLSRAAQLSVREIHRTLSWRAGPSGSRPPTTTIRGERNVTQSRCASRTPPHARRASHAAERGHGAADRT